MTSKIPFAIIPLSRFEIVSSTAPLSFGFSRPLWVPAPAAAAPAHAAVSVPLRLLTLRCLLSLRCLLTLLRILLFALALVLCNHQIYQITLFMPEIFLSPLAFARSRKTTADKLSYFSLIHSLLFLSICYFPLCSQSYWELCLN